MSQAPSCQLACGASKHLCGIEKTGQPPDLRTQESSERCIIKQPACPEALRAAGPSVGTNLLCDTLRELNRRHLGDSACIVSVVAQFDGPMLRPCLANRPVALQVNGSLDRR
jgi:hypothetical protein